MQYSYKIIGDSVQSEFKLFDIKVRDSVIASMYWKGSDKVYQCYLKSDMTNILLQYDGEINNQRFAYEKLQFPLVSQEVIIKKDTPYWFVNKFNNPAEYDSRYSLLGYNSYCRLDNLNLSVFGENKCIAMDFRAGCIGGKGGAIQFVVLAAIDDEFVVFDKIPRAYIKEESLDNDNDIDEADKNNDDSGGETDKDA